MAEKSDTRKRIPAKASGSSSKKCKSFAKGADEDEAFKVEWGPVRERKSRASTRKCGLCRSINKEHEHQFGVVSPAADSAKDPVEALWMCKRCYDWVQEEVPDCDVREVVDELNSDEARRNDVMRSLGFDVPDGDGAEAMCDEVGMPLELSSGEEVGYLIEESFELLTRTEFQTLANKSPEAAKAKVIKRRSPTDGKLELRFAFPLPGRPRPRLTVFSKVSATATVKKTKTGMIEKFRGHCSIAFKSFVKKVIGPTGAGSLSRFLTTLDEHIGKQETPTKPAKQSDPSGPGQADAKADDELSRAVGGRLAIKDGVMTDESAAADGLGDNVVDVDAMGNNHEIFLGMPSVVIPPKRPQSDSLSPLGTAKHWIDRSPLADVLLGAECKRELNQLGLIEKSKEAPPLQRDNASRHMNLIRTCSELWPSNLERMKRERKREVLELVSPAIDAWPSFTQMYLINFDTKPLWENVLKMEGHQSALMKLCDMLKVWTTVGDSRCMDIHALTIRTSTMTDAERAGYFLTEVLLNNVAQWLRHGGSASEAVFFVAENAPPLLRLPEEVEDCEIGPACAKALSDCERIFAVLALMNDIRIPESTPAHVFDDIELFVVSQASGGGSDIWTVVARAADDSTLWQHKVASLRKTAKVCKHFYPDITKVSQALEVIGDQPTVEASEGLAEAATKLEWFEKEIGTEPVEKLSSAILAKFISHVNALPTGAGVEDIPMATTVIDKYVELGQCISRVMPLEDKVAAAREVILRAKSSLAVQASAKKASASIEMFKTGECSSEDVRSNLVRMTKASGGGGDDANKISDEAASIIDTIIRKPFDTVLADVKNLAALAKEAAGHVSPPRSDWAAGAAKLLERMSDLRNAASAMGNPEDGLEAIIHQAGFDKKLSTLSRAIKMFDTVTVVKADDDLALATLQGEAKLWRNKHDETRTSMMTKHLEILNSNIGLLGNTVVTLSKSAEAEQFLTELEHALDLKSVMKAFNATISAYQFDDMDKAITSLVKATSELEGKAKEYMSYDAQKDAITTAQGIADLAYAVMFRGRVARAWHGVSNTDTAKVRSSLVDAQKSMGKHGVTPSKVLGAVLTGVFRKGLRSEVVS
ncbi:unnamed protein product [Prorocentrum cordatum]|uniref:Uncharacterized protein n=1 Tax=Prorocentrum cordatum TaxID=2364126 RepID=A0ABN9TTP6_9DINO|nr:unnamed protein product [Polarella glacialis]